MKKVSVPATNDLCPQTLFVYGTKNEDSTPNFGLFCTASGLGFALAIVLFASLRERVDKANPPECFKGTPISLIAAGLLALAFMGFSGMRF